MIITISGTPGSGKSTIAALLAERLGYRREYMGRVFRDMAQEQGQTLQEFYADLERDPEREKEADRQLARCMREEENLIAEGRVAFLWEVDGKEKINVFIAVDPDEGARRILQDNRPEEVNAATLAQMRTINEQRIALERKRYRALYAIDNHHDVSHFDIVIDSTDKTPKQVVSDIVRFLTKEQ